MFANESKILTSLTPENNISYIIAVDEVGRGAGAGPVVVCASLWKPLSRTKRIKPKWLPLIADSKQLTPEQREECFGLICKDYNVSTDDFLQCFAEKNTNPCLTHSELIKPNKIVKYSQKELKKLKSQENKYFDCLYFSIGLASNHEIDSMNIWNAIQLATNRALFKIQDKIKEFEWGSVDMSVCVEGNPLKNSLFLLDGNMPIKICSDFVQIPQVTIINGDYLLKTIGFSSILAKVSRDKYMINLKEECPHIGFEQHKGYLTKKHQNNLQKFGLTKFHRQSFLKNLSLLNDG